MPELTIDSPSDTLLEEILEIDWEGHWLDIGARWVEIATNLDANAAQFALQKGALEQSSLVSDDMINGFLDP